MLDNTALMVEIAFSALPYDTSPTWTDVSAFVKSIGTKRGRSSEVGEIEAGTATLVLDNADGRFTPYREASPSPYVGNILPRRQVRVRALVSGAYKSLWTGFTERWSFTHPGGTDYAEVSLECVDGLKILGDHKMLDHYGEYIKTTHPTSYYPLFEPTGSIWFNDYSGNNQPVGVLYQRSSNDKSGPGGDALLYNSDSNSVSFDNEGASAGADVDLTGALGSVLPHSAWSMVCWVKLAPAAYDPNPPTPPEPKPYPPDPKPPAPNPASAPLNVRVWVTREEVT